MIYPRLALATILALAATLASAAVETLPFEQVRRGMTGSGRTVFSGTTVESFDVEILGKLTDVAPGRNLILARLSGGPLERTGVLAGMSGSPVYVDGKLIGAVAYSWGFAKEPVAGITPIGEMLEVAGRGRAAGPPAARRAGFGLEELQRLSRPASLPPFLDDAWARLLRPRGTAAAPQLPISVAGLGPTGFALLRDGPMQAGTMPLQAGGAGGADEAAPPLEPGSAVGIKLARGDIEIAATGTATWIDGDQVLAFGHPLFGLGALELPLTGARVEALLPSLSRSSRMATPLAEIGALRQDRATAVHGRLGASPTMIPVRLRLTDGEGVERAWAFDVADDPLLSPLLLYATLNALIAESTRTVGNVSVRIDAGSVIRLRGREDVRLDNVFSGPSAAGFASGTTAFILYLLLNADWAPPQVAGVNVSLTADNQPRSALIRRVTLDRYRVRAGDTLRATVVVAPFRGPELTLTREIEIPPETPPGPLTLHVGGALQVSRTESAHTPIYPRDLDQLILLINNLRRNDSIHIIAARQDTGVYLSGARMPNLPPSAAAILTRPRSAGNFAVLRERGILEEVIPTAYAVEGLTRVGLEVESR